VSASSTLISRRTRGRVPAAGAGLLVLASLLGPASSAQGPVTLTFMDAERTTPVVPAPDPVLADFTRETGIKVTRIPGPEGSFNQLDVWRRSLARGSASDVYSIDVIWPEILSEYLVDLRSTLASEIASDDPVAVANFTVSGKVVAIPYRPQVGMLTYRADLLRRYGYAAPPRTWDELEAMAARIQAGERARGAKDFWGYVWQGAAAEGLLCNALEWQVAEGGGRIIEDDRTVSVNNPQVIRAWERAAHWVGTISPPAVVAYRETDTANVWRAGNAAFFRTWESSYFLRRFGGMPQERIGGAVKAEGGGLTGMPGGKGGRAGTLGGFGLAISRSSAHPREAATLVRFLVRREREAASAREWRTAGPELIDLPAILDPSRTGAGGRRFQGVVARPSTTAGPRYEEVAKAYVLALHSVLTGRTKAPEAVTALEQELVRVTGFKTGRPTARPDR
jgi:trehalose/maltose transport system substrate-binding protein